MGLLQAQKRRDDAIAAVRAAKNDADRKSATAELEASSLALATFQSKAAKDDEPKKPLAEEEEKEDEEEEEEEEEDEEEDDDSDDDKDGDDDSDDDEDDDEEEEEEAKEDEHCKEKALASAQALVASAKTKPEKDAAKANLAALKSALSPKRGARVRSLREACQSVTGKKSTKAIVSALDRLAGTAAATKELAASVRKLQSARKRDRVGAMLATARHEGRITAKQASALKGQSAKWLKAYLAVMPKQVRTVEEGALQGRTNAGGKDGDTPVTDRIAAYDAQSMTPDQRKIVEQQAMSAGKSFDDFLKDINATLAKHGAVGAPRN